MPLIMPFCGLVSAVSSPSSTLESRLNHLRPWDLEAYTYGGLCSYSPLLEDVASRLDYSVEQLAEMDRVVREKNKTYQEVYEKELRASPSPEFKARTKVHNEKQKAGTLERQALEIHRFWNGSQPRCLSSRSPKTPTKISTFFSALRVSGPS
ncbi:hypothetical protein V8F33_004428 [Rhypophila sp. PSN 637]